MRARMIWLLLGITACVSSTTSAPADAGGRPSAQLPGPSAPMVTTVSDVSAVFDSHGGISVREADGHAVYELSIFGGFRDPRSGEPFLLSLQTPLTAGEVRLLMTTGRFERPEMPPYGAATYALPGGEDPRHPAISRWIRSVELVWNDNSTVTLRASLGPIFRREDGSDRASSERAVAEVRGVPNVQCLVPGPVPNTMLFDTRLESSFCRSAVAESGLSRVVSLSGMPLP